MTSQTPAVFNAMRHAVNMLRERLPSAFAAAEAAVDPGGVQAAIQRDTASMSRDMRDRTMTSCVGAALMLDSLLDMMEANNNRRVEKAPSGPAVCLACRGTGREIATGKPCQNCPANPVTP